MAKTLKLWNGRAGCCYKLTDPAWQGVEQFKSGTIYAAAYSRADLRRLIAEYCGQDPGEYEIKNYWSEGHWGDAMTNVTPERGLWLEKPKVIGAPQKLT